MRRQLSVVDREADEKHEGARDQEADCIHQVKLARPPDDLSLLRRYDWSFSSQELIDDNDFCRLAGR